MFEWICHTDNKNSLQKAHWNYKWLDAKASKPRPRPQFLCLRGRGSSRTPFWGFCYLNLLVFNRRFILFVFRRERRRRRAQFCRRWAERRRIRGGSHRRRNLSGNTIDISLLLSNVCLRCLAQRFEVFPLNVNKTEFFNLHLDGSLIGKTFCT